MNMVHFAPTSALRTIASLQARFTFTGLLAWVRHIIALTANYHRTFSTARLRCSSLNQTVLIYIGLRTATCYTKRNR